ncbi:MAG: hypothetical protein V4648_06375 [Bacteroidota bacterium]
MKKIIHLIIVLLITTTTFAQTPNKMSYQSVIRNSKGTLVSNQKVTIQISVLKGSKDGEAVYVENHTTNTNTNGLASLEIGGGEIMKGRFADIDWSNDSYFIKTATDATGNSNFDIVGVSELLSVPYALNARKADNAFSGNYNDLQNKPTHLSQFVNDVFKGNTNADTNLISRPSAGIPSQTWSLFGNSNTNPIEDKLGTTDYQDLVIVTNNIDRLRIQANGDIKLRKSLEVGEDLTVNRNVYLNALGGQTINNGNFTVANAKATLLTGVLNVNGATDLDNTLNVDGATDLNSTLNVNNAAATHLTGVLNVDGATDLNNTLNVDGTTNLNSSLNVNNAAATHLTGVLNVDGATDLNSTLNVDGTSNLNSALNVNNAAATHLTGVLNVDGATDINDTLNVDGQVTITANVSGGGGSFGAHPLRVQGSDQGIAIKLNPGTPDNSNNFITFFNGNGNAVGRIEGETTSEATSDPEFIFDNSILVAEEAKAIANVPLAAIPVVVGGVGASTGPCGACIAMAAADLVLATANLAAYNVFALENLGVTYQSGSADYAEWLERSNFNEKIVAGDIVAVNGGKISKFTQNASQYMVISTKPAILGNMPMDGNEKSFEKVAFMGQIPVKVRGIVVSGDYILPSGLNDGTGIAVAPNEIKAEQYREIVGVAWSNALINGGISTVNMAIGLNGNDVARLAIQQERKIVALENKYSTLEQRLLALENGTTPTLKTNTTTAVAVTPEKLPTRNELLAANMPAELNDQVMEEAFVYLENSYKNQGIDITKQPVLNKLFTDASYKAEIIKKTQEKYKLLYPTKK